MSVDVTAVDAIDAHVHIETDGHGHYSLDHELMNASAAYFKAGTDRTPTVDAIAHHYRQRRLAAVVFTVDAHTATGHPPLDGHELLAQVARHPDVLVPFASVDPHEGTNAVARLRDLAAAGARGLKLHPSLQGFAPNDITVYPLYEAAMELGLPVVFHSGQSGIGAGLAGGRGIRLRYSDPLLVDDVAADLPALAVVLAHAAVPWHDAAIAVATHKANVFVDLSGWAPHRFPVQLVRALGGPLRRKALFGTDYPLITPDRWLAEFGQLDVNPEARQFILKQNAACLLGLAHE